MKEDKLNSFKGELEMDEETFRKGKAKIRACWPQDRIIMEDKNHIVVQCENEAYLRYTRLELPDELEGSPAYQMIHGKVMFQYTEDLDAEYWENVAAEIAGKTEAKGRVREALKELAFRIQIGDILS